MPEPEPTTEHRATYRWKETKNGYAPELHISSTKIREPHGRAVFGTRRSPVFSAETADEAAQKAKAWRAKHDPDHYTV